MDRAAILTVAAALMLVAPLEPVAPDEEQDGWQWFELTAERLGPGTWRDQGDWGECFAELQRSAEPTAADRSVWYRGEVALGNDRPLKAAVRAPLGKEDLRQWLYLDTDGDGEIGDEEPLKGERREIQIDEDLAWWPSFEFPRVQVVSRTADGQQRGVELQCAGYLLGEGRGVIYLMPIVEQVFVARGELDGQPFELRLVDWDGDGRLTAEGWGEDRALAAGWGARPLYQAPRLRETIVINSRLCKAAIDSSRPALSLKPYDEPAKIFKLRATDGRGSEMAVARLEVHMRGGQVLIYDEPPQAIRMPAQERSWWSTRGPWLEYYLRYPEDGDARWKFWGPLDLSLQEEPVEMALGGPLRLELSGRIRRDQGCAILETGTRLVTTQGHTLGGTEGEASIKRRAWVIGLGGDVIATHTATGQQGRWTYDAHLPADAARGKYCANLVFDLGEYQQRLRGAAYFEL